MKTIKYLLFSFLFVSLFSCDVETENIVTGDAAVGGVTLLLGPETDGIIAGTPQDPADLENSTVNFVDVLLNLDILKRFDDENITKYEIYKSYNGGTEIMVAQSATLPLNLHYTSIDDFIAGTSVSDASDLRIGDMFKFRTKVYNADGNSYFIHDGGSETGTYRVFVNCLSDLAGDYTNPDTPACTGSDPVTVTEVAPGRYYVSSMTGYSWTSGGCIGYYILDSCGTLTYDGGDLEDNGYSGEGGEGVVNADGSFTFTCKLNEVGYSETSTYTPL